MANATPSKFEKHNYILSADRALPESEQTIWRVMPLTIEHKALIGDGARGSKEVTALLACFKYGCIGWENLRCGGNPAQFEGLKYSDDIFRVHPKFLTESKGQDVVIPFEWQVEIGKYILELSFLGESEKNS